MTEITKTIRNLDADAYRMFRAKAVELGYSTGAAMNEAIRLWVLSKNRRVTVRAEIEGAHEAAEIGELSSA